MTILQIILVAAGGYFVMSLAVTLAVTRFLRRVNSAAKVNLQAKAKHKRKFSIPRIYLRKSS